MWYLLDLMFLFTYLVHKKVKLGTLNNGTWDGNENNVDKQKV